MLIVQAKVRHYLISVSCLMVFWLVIRSTNYFFTADAEIKRYLWYLYYLPMLFIPLFSLFVAISLGKPANARLSKMVLLLYIPTVLCLLLVLTNDFHQLVFSFPKGEVWTDKNSGYTFGYYIVLGWEILCALAAFVIMLIKCRHSQRKKYLPFLLLTASIVYALIYVSGVEWLQMIGGDITAAQCLMFTGILECCIQCGLIQTNTGYKALFEAGSIGAQIVDMDHDTRYASSNAPKLTTKEIEVLRLICDGLEYDEIAGKLDISERTVKYHVSSILSKTGYANRTRLAIAVTNKKFIVPNIPEEQEFTKTE